MKKSFKELKYEVNEYVIDFLEPQYIDYLDTINFKIYSLFFKQIYIAVLVHSDLFMFEYIHNKLQISCKNMQHVIAKSLPKLSEDKLDYLIINFNNELTCILLNKIINKSVIISVLYNQSLNFNIKLFSIIDPDIFKLIFQDCDRRLTITKYYDVRIVKWLYKFIEPVTTTSLNYYGIDLDPQYIFDHIDYKNLNLIKLFDIFKTFNINYQTLINLKYSYEIIYELCKSNIDVIEWFFFQFKFREKYELMNIMYIICCENRYDAFNIIYKALQTNIDISILNCALQGALYSCNAERIRDKYKIILILIDLGAKPIHNMDLLAYYHSIVK